MDVVDVFITAQCYSYLSYRCMTSQKITKGQSEFVYRRSTDNTVAKRKSTKVPAPLVTPVLLIQSYCLLCLLFAHSGVQHIFCCVFVCLRLVYSMLPVSLNCSFEIVHQVFSNVSLYLYCRLAIPQCPQFQQMNVNGTYDANINEKKRKIPSWQMEE